MTVLVGALAIVVLLPLSTRQASSLRTSASSLWRACLRTGRSRPTRTATRSSWKSLSSGTESGWAFFSLKTWLSALAYLAILTALYSVRLLCSVHRSGPRLHGHQRTALLGSAVRCRSLLDHRRCLRVGPKEDPRSSHAGFLAAVHRRIRPDRQHARQQSQVRRTVHDGRRPLPLSPPVLVWISNNMTSHFTRASAVACSSPSPR